MGGSSYDRDVYSSSSSRGFSSGGTSSAAASRAMSNNRSSVKRDIIPVNRRVASQRKFPIVLGLDVTGSNIEFARICYDKFPMFHGQIEQQDYLPQEEFDICVVAIGDANSDDYPLQVTKFAYGLENDKQLKRIFLEGNGGGQRKESYELTAWYFANMCDIPNAEMPFMFIIADEAPYEYVDPVQVEKHTGQVIPDRIPTEQVFRDLYRKFGGNVFIMLKDYNNNHNSDDSRKIREAWKRVVGRNNHHKIFHISQDGEKGIVDQMLGIIATTRSRSLDSYCDDMKKRKQTQERISQVRGSLDGYSRSLVPVNNSSLPAKAPLVSRNSRARRF